MGFKLTDEQIKSRKSIMGNADAFVRSITNTVTFGAADHIDAFLRPGKYADNLKQNKAMNSADEADNALAFSAGKVAAVFSVPRLGALALAKVTDIGAQGLSLLMRRHSIQQVSASLSEASKAVIASGASEVSAISAKSSLVLGALNAVGKGAGYLVGKSRTVAVKFGIPVVTSAALAPTFSSYVSQPVDAKNDSPQSIFSINQNVMNSGFLAIGAGMLLEHTGELVTPKLKPLARFAELAVKRLDSQTGGLKVAGRFAWDTLAITGKSTWETATGMTVKFGQGLAIGEVLASQYQKDAMQDDPALVTKMINQARVYYTSLKQAGMSADKSIGGSWGDDIVRATLFTSVIAEKGLPFSSAVMDREKRLEAWVIARRVAQSQPQDSVGPMTEWFNTGAKKTIPLSVVFKERTAIGGAIHRHDHDSALVDFMALPAVGSRISCNHDGNDSKLNDRKSNKLASVSRLTI